MFQQTNYQGYVLKPKHLRSGNQFVYDKTFDRITIDVSILN